MIQNRAQRRAAVNIVNEVSGFGKSEGCAETGDYPHIS